MAVEKGFIHGVTSPLEGNIGSIRTNNGQLEAQDQDGNWTPMGGDANNKIVTATSTDGINYNIDDPSLELKTGLRLIVIWSKTNADTSPKLTLNGSSQKNIINAASSTSGSVPVGELQVNFPSELLFNGVDWELNGFHAYKYLDNCIKGLNNYGTCTSSPSVMAKLVSISEFKLTAGKHIFVRFSYKSYNGGTGSLSLNVNNTGAKTILYNKSPIIGASRINGIPVWKDGDVVEFVYENNYWNIVDIPTNKLFKADIGDGCIVHTSGLDNNGNRIDTKNGYAHGEAWTKVIKVPGAKKLKVTATYGSEGTSYDWGCIWAGDWWGSNATDHYSSSISGKLGGNTTTPKTVEYEVDGDVITVSWRSDTGGSQYYGLYVIARAMTESELRESEQLLVQGENNIIIGENNIVAGDDNVIIGNNNIITQSGSMHIGSNEHQLTYYNESNGYLENIPGLYQYIASVPSNWTTFSDERPEYSEACPAFETGNTVLIVASMYDSDNSTYTYFDNVIRTVQSATVNETTADYGDTLIVTTVVLDSPWEPTMNGVPYDNSVIPLTISIYKLSDITSNDGQSLIAKIGSTKFTNEGQEVSGKIKTGILTTTKIHHPYDNDEVTRNSVNLSYGYAFVNLSVAMNRGYTFPKLYPITFVSGGQDIVVKLDSSIDISKLAVGDELYIWRIHGSNHYFDRQPIRLIDTTSRQITIGPHGFLGVTGAENDAYLYMLPKSSDYSDGGFAVGYRAIATMYTSAIGHHVTAVGRYSTIFGKFGTITEENSLALANGTSVVEKGLAFKVLSDGNVHADNSYHSTGADYAEFFEWDDGNPNAEDRVGYAVTLTNGKIKIANTSDKLLGIVSAEPAIIGDNYDMRWNGKYITDVFGRVQYDDVLIPEEREYYQTKEELITSNYLKSASPDIVDNFIKTHPEDLYQLEENIDGTIRKYRIITEAHYEKQPKINPNYDASQEYIPRSERPEWAAIGVIGKLAVYDDGTCTVGSYCKLADNGIVTASTDQNDFDVLKRLNENVVLIWLR